MARREGKSREDELREHMYLRAQYFAHGGVVTRYPLGCINPKREQDESIGQFNNRIRMERSKAYRDA